MREIDLVSIVHAHKNLNPLLLQKYLTFYGIASKKTELDDLESLVVLFQKIYSNSKIYDGYYFGYSIPQISKEFDLLRFGEQSIINIELKKNQTSEKIKSQLVRNQYYLSFLKKDVYNFTYVSDTTTFYSLDMELNLIEVQAQDIIELLDNQNLLNLRNIDDLFTPSNYLVSPFNSTELFVNNQYFLTAHQEEIKKEIIGKIALPGPLFVSICGKSGTGKTLLTFDIAKTLMDSNIKVLIIHCGILNEGHKLLCEHHHWTITAIRHYRDFNLSDYQLVIIDEAQRIYPEQLDFIIDSMVAFHGKCVFSYDMNQWLRKWEANNDIQKRIKEKTNSVFYKLTEKIRTNKEIASFTAALFDKSKTMASAKPPDIALKYFHNYAAAKSHIEILMLDNWKVINYTPQKLGRMPYDSYFVPNQNSTHEVIGQEFDKVIAIIDPYFYYNKNTLSTKNYTYKPYYHPTKMLFQIMTRARNKIQLIIIGNDVVLERCLELLKIEFHE